MLFAFLEQQKRTKKKLVKLYGPCSHQRQRHRRADQCWICNHPPRPTKSVDGQRVRVVDAMGDGDYQLKILLYFKLQSRLLRILHTHIVRGECVRRRSLRRLLVGNRGKGPTLPCCKQPTNQRREEMQEKAATAGGCHLSRFLFLWVIRNFRD